MKAHKNILIPESWDDVTYNQYMEYGKKIKPLGYTPSRLRFMDAINGDGAQEIFDSEPLLIAELGFVHDGPPQLSYPNKFDLGIFTVDISKPIKFHCEHQVNDMNDCAKDLFNMDDFERLERAPVFCALYLQPLINPNYNKEEALKLIEHISKAPVTHVLNLYTSIMIQLIMVDVVLIEKSIIKDYYNTRLN